MTTVYVTGTETEGSDAYAWFPNKASWERQCKEDSEWAKEIKGCRHYKFELVVNGTTQEEIEEEVHRYIYENGY